MNAPDKPERLVVLLLLVVAVGVVYWQRGTPMPSATAHQEVAPAPAVREITALINHGLIEAAAARLAELDDDELALPAAQAARSEVGARAMAVARLYTEIRNRYRAGDFAGLAAPLAEARGLWRDDPTLTRMALSLCRRPWPGAADLHKATCAQVREADARAPVGVPCAASFAGNGRRTRYQCFDSLPGGADGPRLVVIPAAGSALPSFAIGRYEISVAEFNHYCAATTACAVRTEVPEDWPITDLSVAEISAYLAWLSHETGRPYHLPSAAQWSHAVHAEGLPRKQIMNCGSGNGAPRADHAAAGLQAVTRGKRNPWGLLNALGNVRELVTTADGVAARGGSYADHADACTVERVAAHSGAPDPQTGFRVATELASVLYACQPGNRALEITYFRSSAHTQRIKLKYDATTRYLDRMPDSEDYSDGVYQWRGDATAATLWLDGLVIRHCNARA